MSDPIVAAQVEGSSAFQEEVIAAALSHAALVRSVALSGSRADATRASLADAILGDKLQALSRFGRIVALAVVQADGTYDIADIATSIASTWDQTAGVPTQVGALALSAQALSPDFQQRVYVVGARLANDILLSAPPASDASAGVKAVDGIKRVFALKYQAGRFIAPQYQLNYAVNVLALLTPEEAADITDAQIYTRLAELTGLFATTQAALTAAGVNTGLLA
jgi:hypothetical protein